MIKITKTQHYWLFEKARPDGEYYYVRSAIDGQSGYNWFMGYENKAGFVSSVGGDCISDELTLELEKRFQDIAKMVNV